MMAENSKIEWCKHTGNLWWGCVEVHEGCDNCYARTFDKRVGGAHWGAKQPRRAVASVWDNFKKWQRKAAEAGEVHRVFVGSMMDIFERSQPCVDYYGKPLEVTTGELRQRFFDEVVTSCPNLLFLLLTKRPQNITKMVPDAWLKNPPANVMYGTSVVNQETAVRDIPALLKVPGKRFLSIEPLIGPVDLSQVSVPGELACEWCGGILEDHDCYSPQLGIHWIIAGGESGHHARPMHPQWARDIRDQCVAAGVPFLFKQWGEWIGGKYDNNKGKMICQTNDEAEQVGHIFWTNPGQPKVHQWGMIDHYWAHASAKVGKKEAGRLLDGREWNEFPQGVGDESD